MDAVSSRGGGSAASTPDPQGRLCAESAEFRAVRDRHEVVAHRGKRKEFRNRCVGRVTVGHTGLWLAPEPGPAG
ncbi:hypothetical protein [Streptomyces sp. H51]|uniref:MmyB family transcriptional regulator n=1 Tax=Streptomyces sp. H51 TaxID=3111770 RepID=UPI003B640FAA